MMKTYKFAVFSILFLIISITNNSNAQQTNNVTDNGIDKTTYDARESVNVPTPPSINETVTIVPLNTDTNGTTTDPPTNTTTTTEIPTPTPNNTTTTENPTPTNTTTTEKPTPVPPTNTTTTSTTTVTPIPTNVTTTTTTPVTPTTNGTTTTTVKPSPTTTVKPDIVPCRRFDAPSFIGGIILTVGLIGISFVGHKFYKSRYDQNYHTL